MELPEKLVDRLLVRLKRHALRDSLFSYFPPLIVFSYIAGFLYSFALITLQTLIIVAAAVLVVALLITILRPRPNALSLPLAARMVDRRVEGKDRFVTLATIDPSMHPPSLVSRLRREANRLLHRIDIKKDFPYRVKGTSWASWITSLVVVLLFHSLLQTTSLFTPQATSLKELVVKLSQVPQFSELARSLEVMEARIQKEDLAGEEKRALIQDRLEKVRNQLAVEKQNRGSRKELLSQTADSLRGMEQDLDKGQEKGSGELKTDLPEEREGEGKESTNEDGREGQGQSKPSGSDDLKREETVQEKIQEAGRKQGDRDKGTRDRVKGQEETGREIAGLAKGDLQREGTQSRGDEIPRGPVPERFLKPGEQGEVGIKGARFVTVQLPEEETESRSGEGPGKRRKLRSKISVSNVPLRRPDTPDAIIEKQPVPLEYRGLIR